MAQTVAAIPALKDTFGQLKTRMEKAVEAFRKEMAAVRTGRASVHMLDGVTVDYYGTVTPLNQMGNVSAPEPQMITVQPWDISQLSAIEKAIRSSDLGLNPMNDGKLIRVPVPALTEERRKELVKRVLVEGEHAKVAIRNIRRDSLEHIKKLQKDGLSEDIAKDGEGHVQGITDKFISLVDQHCKDKEKEIMTV